MPAVRPFWKRIESLFRSNGHVSERRTRAVDVAPSANAAAWHARSAGNGEIHGDAKPPNGSLLSMRGWRSGKAELREGYQRVIELMNAMEQHFQRQDQRLEQLATALDGLTRTLAPMVAAQREQTEHVARIAEHAGGADTRLTELTRTLRDLPAATRAQNDALKAIDEHLAQSCAIDEKLAQALGKFDGAVDALRESGAVQVDTLNRLDHHQRESVDSLRSFVNTQNRRFLIALGVMLVATLVAAGFIWAALDGLTA
ncbi:MAG: hypothetical protein D6744_11215 [Planctomycetota bacterium]|nr:MAG: hypothetical protein D6744_11215 [Planctomycetota bacterium]